MATILLGLVVLSLVIWLFLLLFWGQFWRVDQQLETSEDICTQQGLPTVCVVIPARNEADVIAISVRSLLLQDYPGDYNIFLVDDHSTDNTAHFAQEVAQTVDKPQQLHIVSSQELPAGWTGKLWAMEQGIQKANQLQPDYFLLTDADIEHNPSNLRRLIAKAEGENLDLVSIMVKLRCQSLWEQLLIPAFVFFFQKLYPFRWVNNPKKTIAAAAGGCMLIRPTALNRIGGIQVIRQALIDDCSLAKAIKSNQGRIWLGLSNLTYSLRPYDSLKTIWDMVARSAYTQLNYSPWLLVGSVLGMILVYLVPPMGIILGLGLGNLLMTITGLITWLLMTLAYFPIIHFYKCSPWLVCCLPIIALFYTLMTIDSAIRHWQGRGGEWKGRVY
ncbi:glycosyltransferase [Anabaena cylindrica FACHB-243]|uniref:Hopene-associated glycosyltransferase HpnB n=1 Tax=Anabaena cylindrica (strain ATCC 27899 / PCC 7122) TaxID=272123 RepID=K9ZPP7_ANACC|nr:MULTISPECIES: glycosyltransferase [Anabaena]AFZ60532.1 hopene-associated glycosyltransferase HpnB [Anabaena cylindrica PCC 7122]MBD2418335.1 glycosyltransferase [Anabaena cylindrica FACHB-243]MBY5285692.1 glycosyltransferase [Anabaena sp. CCAP 1446/1C]MBY5308977.1 glycosyltransferase [Anabaena sp. CCAP 1446/1C]MCM2409967.1 glycosyltransferase [Anabaena sp. CCAP 1446/1C]